MPGDRLKLPARALAIALFAAILGCTKASDSDEADCGDESAWTPGGAGTPDPTLGATREYPNGHSLDWLETDPAVIDDEMRVIELINTYRASRGRGPLLYDRALTRCARGHSRHHYEHGFFQGHTNPEGDDFAERMEANGLTPSTSGENISYGALTPLDAFEGWLNSPGHRENMERGCYTRIGVGCHGVTWTANFAR